MHLDPALTEYQTNCRKRLARSLAVLGVVLVFFIGMVQAVHVHADESSLSHHECSLCSVAHAGVIAVAPHAPLPVVTQTILAVPQNPAHQSLGFASSLRIRPPPSV